MNRFIVSRVRSLLWVPASLTVLAFSPTRTPAQTMYNPVRLPVGGEISDTLSSKDIPTGQGGFARDYLIDLSANDQMTIDVTSDSFDTIVSLIAPDGLTIAENDDGPDGSTNSLLFTRITSPGTYIIRVRAFGETGVGPFNLKVTRLRPI
ncbi:MAG TPA: PPC domain-containing protein [Oscillatoriales cyanobacterium M59_W2019_021]|nr:MAG: peptidase [Cyanobacteria bacterium J055]HIK33819.1 PPC domain-containing protein [Oscillatoriales cyanobacterium M4454_W2019_049]HIK51595.1 PPC domain-containing protein [Oscillatoriales cyanobacterium M59_W2019_021]